MADENTPENSNRKVEELLRSVDANLKELAKLQRQTLDQSTKQYRERKTERASGGSDGSDDSDGSRGVAGRAGRSKVRALGDAAKKFFKPGEMLTSLGVMTAFMAYGRAVNALTRAVQGLTPNIKGLVDIEQRAAKINLQVNGATIESGRRLADAIGKEVTAIDALKFAYTSHEVGIATHGKGMRNLFRATLRTGEDVKRLAIGIREATFGMGGEETTDAVATNLNKLSGALHLSRTELVAAMNNTSAKLKDTLHILAGNGVAYSEATAALSGLIRDPSVFKGITQELESLLVGPQGLQKSMMLGILQARGGILGGGDRTSVLKNMLTIIQTGYQQTERYIAPFRGTHIGPLMLQAFESAGKINTKMVRGWEGLQEFLKRKFPGEQMTDPEKIAKKLEELSQNQQDFVNTFNTFKTMVMRPIMDVLIKMAGIVKKWLQDKGKDLGDTIKFIATVTLNLFQSFLWIGSKIVKHLDSIYTVLLFGLGGKALALAARGLNAALPLLAGRWAATRWAPTAGGPMIQQATRASALQRARGFVGLGGPAAPGGAMGGRGIGAAARGLLSKRGLMAVASRAGWIGLAIGTMWALFGGNSKQARTADDQLAHLEDLKSLINNIGGDTANINAIAVENRATSRGHKFLLNNIQQFAAAQIKQTARVIDSLGRLVDLDEEQILAIREAKEMNVEMMLPFNPTGATAIGSPRGFSSMRRK